MNTKNMVYVSLFASFYALLGLIPPLYLPFSPVPITCQSIAPMLAGSLLGARQGLLATLLFYLLVIIGFPIVASHQNGLSAFVNITAGFFWGWLLVSYTIGWLFERYANSLNFVTAFLITIFCGIIIEYLCGILWLRIHKIEFSQAILLVSVFIPGDLLKAFISSLIFIKIKRNFPNFILYFKR